MRVGVRNEGKCHCGAPILEHDGEFVGASEQVQLKLLAHGSASEGPEPFVFTVPAVKGDNFVVSAAICREGHVTQIS